MQALITKGGVCDQVTVMGCLRVRASRMTLPQAIEICDNMFAILPVINDLK